MIGIVAFGSINSGLGEETSAEHLAYLWSRSNWLAYFFFMAISLIIVYIFIAQLEQVLTARSDINAEPFAGMSARRSGAAAPVGFYQKVLAAIETAMMWVREKLELWIAPQDDKRVAWTLGIGWACCGGGLAGGCLVFAKASCVGHLLSQDHSDVLAHPQSQGHFWQSISPELWQPDRSRVDHLLVYLEAPV